ncbi:MAG: sodium-dependent transporter [Planctomycetaceae bacterium]|jgi:SNF family Na+-dependent transporter|nr:sodium-dependent transporter [Planctomycetaceae bacterium]
MKQKKTKQENWTTQFGVIMAVAGSAIGLGNFLRFPGQAALYGGGAFMIPYFIAFFLIGLPIVWAEWMLGRYAGIRGYHSAPGIFRSVTGKRNMAYAGSFCVTLTTIITSFYIFIEGWCLVYALRYLFGWMELGTSTDFNKLFIETVGLKANGALFQYGLLNFNLLCMVFCLLLNYFLIYRGIVKGIEWFCSWALPALLVCSLIIMIRVLTLGNPTGIEGQSIIDGLGFVWNPSQPNKTLWESLSNPETWLAGAGQVFFSLSLGFGVICTYASYTRRNDDIVLSSLTAVAGNGFCEAVIAAMMIVPAAYIFLGPAFLTPENLNSSFTIGFQVLPEVFHQMPMGRMFGFLFFFLLFLAAVTSSISTLQPAITLLEEGLQIGRKSSLTIAGVITAFGAFFTAYFTKNLTALDTMDFWVCNVLIFIMAEVQIIIFSWTWNIDASLAELQRGTQIRIPYFFRFVMKYVSPLYLLFVFITWFYLKFPEQLNKISHNTVAQLSLGFIAFVTIFNLFITSQALARWEKQEHLNSNTVDGEI